MAATGVSWITASVGEHRAEARSAAMSGRLLPVLVRAVSGLADPVNVAAVSVPASRTTNFWWKSSGFRSVITSTPARSNAAR
jgi:hypothetical protein